MFRKLGFLAFLGSDSRVQGNIPFKKINSGTNQQWIVTNYGIEQSLKLVE